jgi:hypothetical protein
MLPALYDDDRRTLARLASMLIAGGLCILPLTTQTSPIAGAAGVHDTTDAAGLVPLARLTFPGYEINRDPFVPQGASGTTADAGEMQMSSGQSNDTKVVRAIVLGDPPRALIETGGTVRVLGIGDRLGALTVSGISSGRVTLSDGSSLILDGNHR